MKLPDFEYRLPATLQEAVALLASGSGNAKIISGGQSLLPMMAYRVVLPRMLIDLRKIPNLDRIDCGATVTLGARVTWTAIERHQRLRTEHPLLWETVRHIAHYQIRNRGTTGGSLAHADPAAEFPAVALGCDATVNVVGLAGPRTIPLSKFFVAPLVTTLDENEIITSIAFPAWKQGRRFGFREFARRQGDFALAGAVAQFDLDANGRIRDCSITGFGLGDTPLRIGEVEAFLEGREMTHAHLERASQLGAASVEVHSDAQADADYRRALFETMLLRALTTAAAD
ncbi:MAG: xanthine dehydrogenase family protein subunit M [Xanthobacteraceae bacterium]